MTDSILDRFHFTRKLSGWQGNCAAGVVAIGMSFSTFREMLFGSRELYWGDIGLYFQPMLAYLRANLLRGRVPLWNPLILCGTPYVGNPQTWPFYPFSAFIPLTDAFHFIGWTIAAHVALAAFGAFLFWRTAARMSWPAAMLAAVTFAFGGQFVSKEQFPNMLQALAYLPYLLLATDRVVRRRRFRHALLFGALLGLQVLAAHAQMTVFSLYLCLAYGAALAHSLYHRAPVRPKVRLGRALSLLVTAIAVAVGVSLVEVLPTLELLRNAWHPQLTFRVADRFYLPLNQLANFVLPDLHGDPLRGNFSARGNFWETCCYTGWAPAALAVYAAARIRKMSAPLFWTAVAIGGVLLALGGQNVHGAPATFGVYWLAFHLLPGLKSFHDPARCLLWTAFAVSGLAGYGMQSTVLARRPLVAIVLILIAYADLSHFDRSIYPLAPASQWNAESRVRPAGPLATVALDPDIAAGQARFLAPDSARVWQRFTGHRSYRQGSPRYMSFWDNTLTPNLAMAYGLADAYGYEPEDRLDAQVVTGSVVNAFAPNAPPAQRANAAAWAGVLGVKYVAFFRAQAAEEVDSGLKHILTAATLPAPARSHTKQVDVVFLSRDVNWQHRARLMGDYRVVPFPGRLAEMQRIFAGQESFDPARSVVVSADPGLDTGRRGVAVDALPGSAAIVSDTPDRVVIAVSVSRPCLLVLADTLHPGWHATLDGRAVPILSADGCLRALALPSLGRHAVVFTYRPTSVLLGLYVSLLTLSCLIAASILLPSKL